MTNFSRCPNCRAPLVTVRWTSAGMRFICGACGITAEPDLPGALRDTAKEAAPTSREEVPQAETPPLADIPAKAIALPLQSRNIFDAMDELVAHALHNSTKVFGRRDYIADRLREALHARLAEHAGRVTILHMSVRGLKETRLALGIAPGGIDPAHHSEVRPFVVLLSLLAGHSQGPCISSHERRKLCDERTIHKLRTAPDAKSVLQTLKK